MPRIPNRHPCFCFAATVHHGLGVIVFQLELKNHTPEIFPLPDTGVFMPREMRLYIPGEIQVRNVVYSAIWISITFDLGERRAVQIIHRVGIASVSRQGRRPVGNISPQVSVYLVRVCVLQLPVK